MGKRALLVILLCVTASSGQSPRPADDPWMPLRFLLGAWDAKTQGGSAGADSTGQYVFRLELKNHVLARHSSYASCKAPTDFNCDHGDFLYAYSERGVLRAIYFDNEGHVIHYNVTSPAPNSAEFLSNASEPGPQFRLLYELKQSVMYGKFQVKMPGQGEFKTYLEWSGKKIQES